MSAKTPNRHRVYFLKNRMRIAARRRKLYALDPEKYLRYNREWRLKNKDKVNARRRRRVYGADIDHLFYAQAGRCAVCEVQMLRTNRNPRAAHIDHDHTTGKVRGLLCSSCNMGLGVFKDSPDLLRQAIKYLEMPRG